MKHISTSKRIMINDILSIFNQFAFFAFKKLNYLPNIGDNITIPFLRAKLGLDFFCGIY